MAELSITKAFQRCQTCKYLEGGGTCKKYKTAIVDVPECALRKMDGESVEVGK